MLRKALISVAALTLLGAGVALADGSSSSGGCPKETTKTNRGTQYRKRVDTWRRYDAPGQQSFWLRTPGAETNHSGSNPPGNFVDQFSVNKNGKVCNYKKKAQAPVTVFYQVSGWVKKDSESDNPTPPGNAGDTLPSGINWVPKSSTRKATYYQRRRWSSTQAYILQ